jgi:hypothetical protein
MADHGDSSVDRLRQVKVKVILRPTVSQSVLVSGRPPSRTREQFFLFHGKSFKTFAFYIMGRPLSREDGYFTVSFQTLVPVLISSMGRVAKLRPQALGFLFVACSNSQGNCGGNLSRPHVVYGLLAALAAPDRASGRTKQKSLPLLLHAFVQFVCVGN